MTDAGAVVGWDVGGANLKAVRLAPSGASAWCERPFPLWREPAALPGALAAIARDLGPADVHGVTMTAELADCFATKRAGVSAVLDALERALSAAAGTSVRMWIGDVDGDLVSLEQARRAPLSVAGANWAAAARWLVSAPGLLGEDGALLLDVGSTTADVIPLAPGRILARGRSDPERLLAGELVYVGALRTPVCALLETAPFRGRECPVAAEHFAIAADAHVWLGSLPEAEYGCETADGGPATRAGARTRLARVVCADGEMLDDEEITAIAGRVADAQLERLVRALRRVATAAGSRRPVLTAGSGEWLGRRAAERAGLPVSSLVETVGAAARVLPAFAVAQLIARLAGAGNPRGVRRPAGSA